VNADKIKESTWAAEKWKEASLSAGTKAAKESCEKAAESLMIEIRTGTPVCACCHKPFKLYSTC